MSYNFKTHLCTTKEQSKRLLKLGLHPKTADMYYPEELDGGELPLISDAKFGCPSNTLPAWSLHRLMTLCPEKLVDGRERVIKDMYTPDEYELWVSLDQCSYLDVTARYGGETLGFFYEDGNLYDALIACIEWLIKEGHFNKEYLE
jgi:hypothetical protein